MMTYEFIQAALTNLITFTAIAGLTGIILHSFYTHHKEWMAVHCPAVKPFAEAIANPTPDTQVEVNQPHVTEAPVIETEEPQPLANDVWEGEVEPTKLVCFRPVSRHFSPQLSLPPAKEEVKQSTKKTRKTPTSPKAPAKPRTTRKRKTA